MGTEDSSVDGAGAPAPAPAPASEPPAPPAAPLPAPAAPGGGRSRSWRWLGIAVCVVAVAAAAAAVVAYGQATDDKRTAERELVRVERDLADETARADAAEAEVETQAARADAAEASAEQLGRDVADRDEEIGDYRSSTADFLAISVEFGLGASPSDASCIAEALVEDRGAEALGALVESVRTGSSDLDSEVIGYAEGCGVDPDSLTPATAVEPGFAYGDNPVLDELWDACAAGDGQSCDDLFLNSEAGSEYEQFGLTCGERFTAGEAPEICAGEI